MTLQNLISIILYISFVTYALIGAYSFTLNKEARLNRLFMSLCLCFSLWSFAFAVGNSAGTYAEALFWRRIAVLGWGVAYCVILHFIIVLTGANWSRKEKKPLLLMVLYVPAVLNVIIIMLYSQTTNAQMQLIHTVAGWAIKPANDFWNTLFYLYSLGFSLTAIVLLLRWFRSTKNFINKKKALYLLISFSVALFLGMFADILANHFLNCQLPYLTPLVIMILMGTIYHIIHKYGLISANWQNNESSKGIILNADSRAKLFQYIGIVLATGSIINFYLQVILSRERETGILFSFVLVLMSVVLMVIPYLIKQVKYQQLILTLLILAILPIVMLAYYDGPFSNIIWPVPILIIMITVISNDRRLFFFAAVLSLLLGVLFWVRMPSFNLIINGETYALRLLFYAIGISLTALITNIYVSRLMENRKQRDFQKLIAEISTDFVTMTRFDFDDKVKNLLKKSGLFINADRAAVALFSDDSQSAAFTHEWVREAMEFIDKETEKCLVQVLDWSRKQLLDNAIVYIPSIDRLAPEADEDRRILKEAKIQSLICIPIHSKDSVIGFIGFDQISKDKVWKILDFELLRVLTNIVADAIAKVETEKEINDLAYYDALTNLPNRVLFNDRLEQALALAKRSGKLLGVIFLDLDGFKEVNDTLGHDWGDHLLNKIGKRLSACVRKYDTVARFGGDEFLIMVPQLAQKKDLDEVAKKIMGIFQQPVMTDEQEFFMNASSGIAVFPEDGEDVITLLRNADMAMYVAKKNGKGQAVFCSGKMKNDVLEKVTLTNSLYQALEKNELMLHYQPQVSAASREIIGFEALLRWEHQKLGTIPPAVFIPIAEETGLINSIGEWVLMTACAQNKEWQDKGFKPVQMAVNLSLEQFKSENLEAIVKKCLVETGLDPRYLELEITESIAMKESGDVTACLHRLKAIGVTISIDDFGTEFSSLGRLKDLPVDRLKIDMEFIHGISQNLKDESIIVVMIHLAKMLGLQIIAEGVETEIQLGFLKDEACDAIQGFYYYKPLSKNEIEGDIYKTSPA
ncbi:EAL domain-containing protein [Acetobacterium tundrae]|uniref:EAL domain-containing protein n=1 Tax=Acetobacterium tundrae TaxID=132932 RepID=A0ABR6WMH2_9FIRM|nr:EAL domain-containing protein [Acetobacterium tundrae]MBC3797322.1 EAL domain-containing protein [Acetobacterium tundrae]